MKKKVWIAAFVVCFLITALGVIFIVNNIKREQEYNKYEHRGLPIIEISLNDITLDEIDSGEKETEYKDNKLKLFKNGSISEFDDVTIRGRGNGTWLQDKKPYRIKFKDKVNLFGMGKAKKWNLLANAVDDTFLRNDIAFYMAKMLKMQYGFDGRFVELYIDGDYRGLYYLTHVVEISKTVVNLKDPNGILVELDNFYGNMGEYYKSLNGEYLVIKDLVNKDNEKQAMKVFLECFNKLEKAIKEKDFETINDLIDVESFAEYYLLSEFSVNPDAYWTSFYLYKDGINDRIHAGPGWDFDLAFGNRRWGNWLGERVYSPTEKMVRKQEFREREFFDAAGIEKGYERSLVISRLVFDLMDITEFEDVVKNVYQERLSAKKEVLISHIIQRINEIYSVAILDDKIWAKKSFEDETEKLIDWIKERYDYFEKEYGE